MHPNRSRGTLMPYTDHSVQHRHKSNTPDVTAHEGAPPPLRVEHPDLSMQCRGLVALFPTQHYRHGTDYASNPLPIFKEGRSTFR